MPPTPGRLLEQHCRRRNHHTHTPTRTPDSQESCFGWKETHSLRCRSIEPGGRRDAHQGGGGGGETLVEPGENPPAIRGQCCERKSKHRLRQPPPPPSLPQGPPAKAGPTALQGHPLPRDQRRKKHRLEIDKSR